MGQNSNRIVPVAPSSSEEDVVMFTVIVVGPDEVVYPPLSMRLAEI